jgi:hypothetical protein
LSYTHRKSAGQSGTNRTTQVEISNLVRLTFPGRVTVTPLNIDTTISQTSRWIILGEHNRVIF